MFGGLHLLLYLFTFSYKLNHFGHNNMMPSDNNTDKKLDNTNVVVNKQVASSTRFSLPTKFRSKSLLTILGILIIFIIGIVIYLLIQKSGPVLTVYSFTNSAGSKYQIKYYQNSEVKEFGFGATNQEKALVSPTLVKNGGPLAITMGGFGGNLVKLNKALLGIRGTCPIKGSDKATTTSITSLGVEAVICSVNNVYYYSYFGSGDNSIYFIQLAPYGPGLPVNSSTYNKTELNSAPTIKDVKEIFGSFRYISG